MVGMRHRSKGEDSSSGVDEENPDPLNVHIKKIKENLESQPSYEQHISEKFMRKKGIASDNT